MPKYAYGIAASDQEIARSDLHQQTRNRNIADLLNGVGVLAQSLGAAHRYAQQNANQATTASMMAGMLQSPEGVPLPPTTTTQDYSAPGPAMQSPYSPERQNLVGTSPATEGPTPPSETTTTQNYAPWNTIIQRQMAQQARPASALEKFGNMFNMTPQGKLDPQAAMGLLQMQSRRSTDALDQAKTILEMRKMGEEIAAAPGQRNHIDSETLLNQALAQKAARGPEAAPRNPEVTAKDLAAAQGRIASYQSLLNDAKLVEDPKADSAAKKAANIRLALNKDVNAQLSSSALQQKIDSEKALVTKLQGGTPTPTPTQTTTAPGNAIEAKYLEIPGAAEVLNSFKAAHGITGPLDADSEAAFRAWVAAQRGG